MRWTRTIAGALAVGLALGAGATAAASGTPARAASSEWGAAAPAAHEHVWKAVDLGREWVPPKTVRKKVGTDEKGRPIYEEVVVTPGYYRTIRGKRCDGCGAVKRD